MSQSRERAANREAVVLHDMEGAAIYQAGSYWLGPHQMSFIKVISDHGTDQISAGIVQPDENEDRHNE